MAEKSDGCCCCGRKRAMRVAPIPENLKEILEIRPNRRLRVRHINPKPRDQTFLKEWKVYLDNIKTAATTPRVVTVPRLNLRKSMELSRNINSNRSDTTPYTERNFQSEHLPNMTTHANTMDRQHLPVSQNMTTDANTTDLKPQESNSQIYNSKSQELQLKINHPKTNELLPGNKEASDLQSESRASMFSHGERSVMSASSVHVAMDLYGKKIEKDKPSTAQSIIAETDEPLSSRSSHSITMHNGLPPSKYSARRQSNNNDQGLQNSYSKNIPKSSGSPRKSKTTTSQKNLIDMKQILDKELVLFFIHGVGGSSDIWKAQLDFFEKFGCEIICLDLIGHGLSDAPDKKDAYTFIQILLDITEIFDRFCKRRNVIIGHSYGLNTMMTIPIKCFCADVTLQISQAVVNIYSNPPFLCVLERCSKFIEGNRKDINNSHHKKPKKRDHIIDTEKQICAFATVIARERRKWMSKLILVSGGGPTPLAPQPGVFSLPLCLLACCRPCLNSGFERGAFHSKFKSKTEKQKAFDVPTYVLSYVMNGQFWPDGDDLYHSWISVPTLLVYGEKDQLVDQEEEEEMLKTIYGSHLEVVEDAGHMVMMETPDRFNQLLFNFLMDQPLGTENFIPEISQTDFNGDSLEVSQRNFAKSEASLHSIRSCKSTKSMPHGLLLSSRHHHQNA